MHESDTTALARRLRDAAVQQDEGVTAIWREISANRFALLQDVRLALTKPKSALQQLESVEILRDVAAFAATPTIAHRESREVLLGLHIPQLLIESIGKEVDDSEFIREGILLALTAWAYFAGPAWRRDPPTNLHTLIQFAGEKGPAGVDRAYAMVLKPILENEMIDVANFAPRLIDLLNSTALFGSEVFEDFPKHVYQSSKKKGGKRPPHDIHKTLPLSRPWKKFSTRRVVAKLQLLGALLHKAVPSSDLLFERCSPGLSPPNCFVDELETRPDAVQRILVGFMRLDVRKHENYATSILNMLTALAFHGATSERVDLANVLIMNNCDVLQGIISRVRVGSDSEQTAAADAISSLTMRRPSIQDRLLDGGAFEAILTGFSAIVGIDTGSTLKRAVKFLRALLGLVYNNERGQAQLGPLLQKHSFAETLHVVAKQCPVSQGNLRSRLVQICVSLMGCLPRSPGSPHIFCTALETMSSAVFVPCALSIATEQKWVKYLAQSDRPIWPLQLVPGSIDCLFDAALRQATSQDGRNFYTEFGELPVRIWLSQDVHTKWVPSNGAKAGLLDSLCSIGFRGVLSFSFLPSFLPSFAQMVCNDFPQLSNRPHYILCCFTGTVVNDLLSDTSQIYANLEAMLAMEEAKTVSHFKTAATGIEDNEKLSSCLIEPVAQRCVSFKGIDDTVFQYLQQTKDMGSMAVMDLPWWRQLSSRVSEHFEDLEGFVEAVGPVSAQLAVGNALRDFWKTEGVSALYYIAQGTTTRRMKWSVARGGHKPPWYWGNFGPFLASHEMKQQVCT